MTQSWKIGGEAYLALLAAAELAQGIPTDLLARIAFEECSWRPEVISGEVKSSAAAVGIMQLEPADFPGIDPTDPKQAIPAAAEYLKHCYVRFSDWQAAVIAYNWGEGNVHKFIAHGGPVPTESANYVRQICADVPIDGSILSLLPKNSALA